MLEDQRQHGRPEEGHHAGRERCNVDQLGARRRRDDLGRDLGEFLFARRDRVALALFRDAFDNLPVDLARQKLHDECGVRRLDRVDDVHHDLDHRLLAGPELRLGVARRHDDDLDLLVLELLLRGPTVGGDLRDD